MSDKDVSVIIPAYNAAKYIKETIKSVLTYKSADIEVIIVDDGSTDSTRDICEEIDDSRVRIISIKNSGVSVARNTGIKNACGKYCMFLDADDVLIKDTWIEVMNSKLYMDYDFLIFGYRIGNEKLELIKNVYPFTTNNITKEDIFRVLGTSTHMNYCWGKIFRTSFLLDNDVFFPADMKIGEDTQFQMDLLQKNPTNKYIDKELVIYRQINSSVMHKFSIDRFDDLVNDLIFRKRCLSYVEIQENDYDLMYTDECRNLLSYIKKASGIISKDELRDILNIKQINEILTKVKISSISYSMAIVVILLRAKLYDLVLMILKRI